MIIKDAPVSARRVAWRSPRSPVALAIMPAPDSKSSQETNDARMSVDEVATWLATQGEATRAAVAHELARELARELEPELENVRRWAYEAGLGEGRVQGLRQAQEQERQQLEVVAALSTECEQHFKVELERLQNFGITLVEEVVRKIAGPLLGSREAIVGAVTQVLARLPQERELCVGVSAEDLPVLESRREQLARALGERALRFRADDRVRMGGCIVESRMGVLDGRVELQLAEFCKLIRAEKNQQSGNLA